MGIDLRGAGPAVRWFGARFWLLTSLALVYGGSYASLRLSRTLVRTGAFHNLRQQNGDLHPDAGWMRSGVQRGSRCRLGPWVEVVYWPLIRLESVYWDTLGRRQRIDAFRR